MRATIPKLFQSTRRALAALFGNRAFLFVLATLLLAAFLYEPIWFGRRVQPSERSPEMSCSNPGDRQSSAAFRLHRAWETERDGNIDPAEKQYLAAVDSTTACISGAARLEMSRIALARERWGLMYGLLADWAHVSSELRTPLLFLFPAWIAYLLLAWFIPRKGIRIGQFSVHGAGHSEAADQFVDSLLSFSLAIRRAYGAEYLRRAGLTALFEDLTGPTVERADAFEKALADAGDSDVKSVVLLAFKALNFLRRLSERPRFKLEGNVYLLRDTAHVTAALKELGKRHSKEVFLQATLAELDAIPSATLVRDALLLSEAARTTPRHYAKAEDLRDVTQQLHGLALVLASKLRSMQLQAKEAEYRPRNWVTVCLFTAAAASLEE